MVKIKIIVGTTRPNRFGIQPARWLHTLSEQYPNAQFEFIDLKDLQLPLFDESFSPQRQQYEHDHTKRWSAIIDDADGFVFVTPEYNHSTSAALKNALDYAWFEWNYKPVGYVGYGTAGGARAIEHLRGIAGEQKMFDIRETVMIYSHWEHQNEDGDYMPTEKHEQSAHAMLKELIFWAEQLKSSREAHAQLIA